MTIGKASRSLMACGIVLGAASGGFVAVRQAAAQERPSSDELSYVGEVQLSKRLHEITLRTPALATRSSGLLPPNPTGQTKVRVLLPENYDPNGTVRYPVLYLYHGGGGNQAEWTTPADKGQAEALTAGLPLIVVMPEGGLAGGYTDWFNEGAFGPPKWKTYHLDQLIAWIDARYRTVADRGGRATAGLSMGGGGLRYAAQRPDLIGATAAFSGDIDILQPKSDWNGMGAPISRLIWGDRKTQEVHWRAGNGPDLAGNLSRTDVAIFSGDTGHPEGVYILPGARALHDRLEHFGIAHTFRIYPGMTHSWPTWNKALAEWLPQLMNGFRSHRAGLKGRETSTRQRFTYSTIAPAYALFGWEVRIERKAVEFSALKVEGPRSFAIVGSGKAVVRSPSVGKPNSAVRVRIGNAPAVRLRTDEGGRLSIPVDLGPANPFQQYSPQADAASTGARPAEAPFVLRNDGSRFATVAVRIG